MIKLKEPPRYLLLTLSHQSQEHLCLLPLIIIGVCSVLLLVSLLDADEEKVLVRGNKNFLSFGSYTEESHVVHWIDVTHHRPSLHRQVSNMVCNVLWGGCCSSLVSLCDDSALIIDDQESADTLMIANTIDSFFEISH